MAGSYSILRKQSYKHRATDPVLWGNGEVYLLLTMACQFSIKCGPLHAAFATSILLNFWWIFAMSVMPQTTFCLQKC